MPTVIATEVQDNPQTHEDQHVHAVYDQIASHFSSTRYKPWPIIAQFLSTLSTGSIGLDSGTGNGKYLPLPFDRPAGSIWTIGLDRSRNLLEIAKIAGQDQNGSGTPNQSSKAVREVVWGDVLGNSWRSGAFDFALSVATIHHLATATRRKTAVKRLLQSVSATQGRVLIYVWAIEQDELSKRSIPVGSEALRSDIEEIGFGQDVFVPWVLSSPKTPKARLQVENTRRVQGSEEVIGEFQTMPAPSLAAQAGRQVLNRYYHMFAQGELEDLLQSAASDLGLVIGSSGGALGHRGVEIVQNGWEKSNYYMELKCWQKCKSVDQTCFTGPERILAQ